MDDLICCSSTLEGHISLLENTFQALQAAGLTFKPSKVQLGPKEVKYLGHILSADGIRVVKSVAKRWGPKHDEAFAEVKRLVTNAPVLHFPDFSKEFVIHVDAPEVGAGAFLAQQNGDDVNIVAYFSQRFSKSQQHYSTAMKECYAVASNSTLASLFMG
ncbi:unnamed protein product [Ectocarpus sp. CCAP 1310/34]|nr:unnamed protein product [Ectocarpus sp. CCAP 1310/34]